MPEFRFGGMRRGLVISLTLHGAVLAALLVHLPAPQPPPEGEAVAVTLVEPPTPEPEKPPEPEPDPPAPDPPAPEPPAPQPEVAPEPQAPEQAEDQATPPPPDEASPGELAQGEAVPIPVVRPVFRFGETDSGPREALDGNSADEPTPLDAAETQAGAPSGADGTDPGQSQPAGTGATASPPEPATPAPETPDASATETAGLSLPELTLPESGLLPGAVSEPEPAARSSGEAPAEPATAPVAAEPAPPPEGAAPGAEAGAAQPADLREASELFSPDLTGDRAAMVAMGSLPRELRASQLCTTELREQLSNGRPRYGVELLPAYRLDAGNVLAVPNAAFLAGGAWYDLSFRCTVDDQAFRVLDFALSVGDPIPRSEWKARGFPDF